MEKEKIGSAEELQELMRNDPSVAKQVEVFKQQRTQKRAQKQYDDWVMSIGKKASKEQHDAVKRKLGLPIETPVNPQEIQQQVTDLQEGANFAPGSSVTVNGVNAPINRKYTGEEVKSLASAESLRSEIGTLLEIINEDEKIWEKGNGLFGKLKSLGSTGQGAGSLPFGGFSEQGQRFNLYKTSIGDRILRLRSGAQINETEFKRFMSLLPKIWRKDSVDKEALNNFVQEFESIEGRIKEGALWDNKLGKFIKPDSKKDTEIGKQDDEEKVIVVYTD